VDRLVEEATGVNPWAEWAKLEIAQVRGQSGNEFHDESRLVSYAPPPRRYDYAGLLVSLSRQEWPDSSAFDDPEVVWRMHRHHHIGLLVRSPHYERVQELIAGYLPRIHAEYTAVEAPLDKPPT